MTLDRSDFDAIDEKDLLDLIDVGVPEGPTIEYKRDAYGPTDRKEVLKDITSFANSGGGHVVIGMEEEPAGVPKHLTGLAGVDLDKEINRLEALLRDGVEPRALGIRIRPVAVRGGAAIVVRIPKSWNPPHRVTIAGSNRFFVRNSGGAHEASVEELRALFTLTADAEHRIADFRAARISKVVTGQGPVSLPVGALLFAHLVPLAAFGQGQSLDLEVAYRARQLFWPMGASGATPRYNLDGVINVRSGEVCHGYTQIFRRGMVEATKALNTQRGEERILYWGDIIDMVDAVSSFVDGMRTLDVRPPIVVSLSFYRLAGAKLGLKGYDRRLDEIEPFPPVEPLLLPDIILQNLGTKAETERALAPALDALWNAAGLARCTYYDPEGNWKPPT